MRYRVSRNIRVGRLLIIPVTAALLFVNIYVFFISGQRADNSAYYIVPGISAIVLIVAILFYRYFDRAMTIEYDEMNMFITDKSGTHTIPLGDIKSLTMTTTRLNDIFQWKLVYIENQMTEEFVLFFPRPLNLNLGSFGKAILNLNPNAQGTASFLWTNPN
jgi:hypothetical protein